MALLIGLAYSMGVTFRRRADRSGGKVSLRDARREEGLLVLILLRVSGLALMAAALAYLIHPESMRWSALPLPWARWLGAALAACMIPLIYWLFSSLGKNVTPTVLTREQHALVTTGPYRWVRHPLYSVGALFWLFLSLVAANWFIGLVILVASPVMGIRTHLEEQKLVERFGKEYEEYRKRTGQFFPRLFSF